MDDVLHDIAAPAARLLKPAEVAEQLGVTERTLERWRQTGDGPAFLKFSRQTIRYRQAELDQFVEAKVRHNTAS